MTPNLLQFAYLSNHYPHVLQNMIPDLPLGEVSETGAEIRTDYRTCMKWRRQGFFLRVN